MFGLIIVQSCKKEILIGKSSLDDAKAWYTQQKSQSFLKSSRGDSIEIKQEPQWQAAQTVNLPNGETAIVVPINTNLYRVTGKKGNLNLVIAKVKDINQSKLVNVFARDKADTVSLAPIQLYEKAFAKNSESISNTKLNSTKQDILVLQDHNIFANNDAISPNIKDNITMNSSGCIDYYWVTSYWINDVIVNQWYDFMYSICPGGSGGSKDTEQGATNEDGSPQTGNQDIKLDSSITNNAKINCLLKKMLGLDGMDGNAQLKALLQAFTGKGYNINFNIGTVADPNSKGQTTYNPYQPTNYAITLDRNKINDESQMSWVKTLLHEAFHANLMQKSYEMFGDQAIGLWAIGPKDLSLEELMDKIENITQSNPTLAQQHHEFMALNIDIIKNGLKSFSATNNPPSIHNMFTDDNFYGLAYEGLNGTSYYLNKVIKNPDGSIKMKDLVGTMTPLNTIYVTGANNLQNDSNINCN